jgi:hypothetical protein
MHRHQRILAAATYLAVVFVILPFACAAQRPGTSDTRKLLLDSMASDARNAALTQKKLDPIDQKLNNSPNQSQFGEILRLLNEQKRSSLIATLLPAAIAAAAALGGILIGGLLQDRMQRARLLQEKAIADEKSTHERDLATAKASQDRELAEKQAKLQIGNAVVDWQLKQLFLLYGPLRAVLGQSGALYRQMNLVLTRADTNQFRLLDVPRASGPNALHGKEFQIFVNGSWDRFRTVLHIDRVYGCGYGVETYFDEIVAIGSRIVDVIEEHAGYARPDDDKLIEVFAQYLAHFAVLKHLHGLAKSKAEQFSEEPGTVNSIEPAPTRLIVDVSAVFPSELHDLVNAGFSAISQDIEHWRQRAIT